MRHLALLIAFCLITPGLAQAQPHLLVGAGVTSPSGDIADLADTGFHIQAGFKVSIPSTPVSLQADGGYHTMSGSDATADDTKVLAGALSVVYSLGGIGLSPYLLGGVGRYRIESGLVGMTETRTDSGYHAGFGVSLGGLGFGGFAEIRYVKINGDPTAKLIPVTLGLRF